MDNAYSSAAVSTVSPAAMAPTIVAMSIRVPVKQGVPEPHVGIHRNAAEPGLVGSTEHGLNVNDRIERRDAASVSGPKLKDAFKGSADTPVQASVGGYSWPLHDQNPGDRLN